MWGQLASMAGKWFSNPSNQKMAVDLGTKALGAAIAGKGAKEANAQDMGQSYVGTLAAPTARRDAIAHDENVAGSQAQAGSLANNMADRTNTQALKLAILQGANMGGVSAPSFLAGKTGAVSGPQWSPEQIMALRDAWGKDNANVQTSIDDLRARKSSDLTNMVYGAAQREDVRQKALFDQMQKQAMESGALGEGLQKPGTPWWKKLLVGGGAAVGGALLANKFLGGKSDPISINGGASPNSIAGVDQLAQFLKNIPKAKMEYTYDE